MSHSSGTQNKKGKWAWLASITLVIAVVLSLTTLNNNTSPASAATRTVQTIHLGQSTGTSCTINSVRSQLDKAVREYNKVHPNNTLPTPSTALVHKYYEMLCPSTLTGGVSNGNSASSGSATHSVSAAVKATTTGDVLTASVTRKVTDVPAPPSCVSSVTQSMTAKSANSSQISAGVNKLCPAQLVQGVTVTGPASSPSAANSRSASVKGAPSNVWQETAWMELCSAVSCGVWYEKYYELDFYSVGQMVFHALYGYNWSYIHCNQNGAIGYTVTVNGCFWDGQNPAYPPNHNASNVQFHVSFLFKGFPISAYHWMEMWNYSSGSVQFYGN